MMKVGLEFAIGLELEWARGLGVIAILMAMHGWLVVIVAVVVVVVVDGVWMGGAPHGVSCEVIETELNSFFSRKETNEIWRWEERIIRCVSVVVPFDTISVGMMMMMMGMARLRGGIGAVDCVPG